MHSGGVQLGQEGARIATLRELREVPPPVLRKRAKAMHEQNRRGILLDPPRGLGNQEVHELAVPAPELALRILRLHTQTLPHVFLQHAWTQQPGRKVAAGNPDLSWVQTELMQCAAPAEACR